MLRAAPAREKALKEKWASGRKNGGRREDGDTKDNEEGEGDLFFCGNSKCVSTWDSFDIYHALTFSYSKTKLKRWKVILGFTNNALYYYENISLLISEVVLIFLFAITGTKIIDEQM